MKSKKISLSSIFLYILLLISIAAFLFFGYKIISTLIDYKKASDTYDSLASIYGDTTFEYNNNNNDSSNSIIDTTNNNSDNDSNIDNDNNNKDNNNKDNNNSNKNTSQNKSPSISSKDKFSKLYKLNNDYIGWITIPGTNINYPLVKSSNNTKYLNKDFYGNKSSSGTIFMDFENKTFHDSNVILYGHNMRNGTMFNNLKKYKSDRSFFNKNKYIYIQTENTLYKYEVFSVHTSSSNFNYIATSFQSDSDFINFYNNIISVSSLVNKNISVFPGDTILTLSTCSYEFKNARTVLHAKLIKTTNTN